jgi:hypothetical protein
MDRRADYGFLDGISRNPLDARLIADNWEDLLRVAGCLKLGAVSASELMRTLRAPRRASTLAAAVAEVGRAAKGLALLSHVDPEAHRRRVLVARPIADGRARTVGVVPHRADPLTTRRTILFRYYPRPFFGSAPTPSEDKITKLKIKRSRTYGSVSPATPARPGTRSQASSLGVRVLR